MALSEISRIQKYAEILICILPFQKAVLDVAEERMCGVHSRTRDIETLQYTTEAFLLDSFVVIMFIELSVVV